MTTAYRTSSVSGRLRTLVLAGSLALGTMFPIATIVWADAGDPVVVEPTADPADGFDISGEGLSGRTAVIAGDGDGANLRVEPAQDADVLSSLPEGTEVALRIDVTDTVYDPDGVTRWWSVSVGGSDGWVSGFFLADASSGDDGSAEPTTEPVPAETTPPAAEVPVDTGTQFEFAGEVTGDASAQVAGAGESVNVRAQPASDSELVTIVADVQIVTLRIAAVDTVIDGDGVTRWWPVTVDGAEGWISGFFLTNVTAAPAVPQATEEAASATEEPVSSDATTSPFPVGSSAAVGSGDGFSVTLRAAGSPAADVVGNLSDGQVVQVVDGPVSFESSTAGWFEVTVDDLSGFVDGDLLSATPEPAPATPADGEPEETAVATTDPAEAEPTADPAETPAPTATATETATEAATTEPADDETPVSTSTAIPTTVATTEPDVGDDDEQDGPIPADTSDPETTPETDPEGEEAAGSTGFIYPLEDYRRTQGFGCSSLGFYPFDPDFGCAVHDGLDLAAPSGTPLLAAADGEVIAAGWCDCGLGYYVEIDHGEGVNTVYGHMESQPFVSTGQQVSQGDVIGPLGSTGISTGPHVHFMVRVNGVAQNPESYLP